MTTELSKRILTPAEVRAVLQDRASKETPSQRKRRKAVDARLRVLGALDERSLTYANGTRVEKLRRNLRRGVQRHGHPAGIKRGPRLKPKAVEAGAYKRRAL